MFKRNNVIWILLLVALLLAVPAMERFWPSWAPVIDEQHPTSEQITKLTALKDVAAYVKEHQQLPAFYIIKKVAREKGWEAKSGNLCDVMPYHAIGGDHFRNQEGKLPENRNRIWYEADLNYRCGRRGPERLLYSNDGLMFMTTNHYRTFKAIK